MRVLCGKIKKLKQKREEAGLQKERGVPELGAGLWMCIFALPGKGSWSSSSGTNPTAASTQSQINYRKLMGDIWLDQSESDIVPKPMKKKSQIRDGMNNRSGIYWMHAKITKSSPKKFACNERKLKLLAVISSMCIVNTNHARVAVIFPGLVKINIASK